MGHVDHRRDSGAELRFERGDIERVAHRHLQRQRAVEAVVVVLRDVLTEAERIAADGKHHGVIEDRADHVDFLAFDRRCVGEDLEA